MPLEFVFQSAVDTENHVEYGSIVLSCDDILRNTNKVHNLVNAKGRVSGTFVFNDFQIVDQPSFVDYLKSDWFINLCVAIDFTASNGEKHQLSEDPEIKNDYHIAIEEVGKILEPYAYKQKFSGFGFGAIPEGETQVSHLFNLNGNKEYPEIHTLKNVIKEYRKCASTCKPWGPSTFTTLLKG